MRLRHVKHARATISENPQYVISDPIAYKGHWHELFQDNHPIELEIGSGKGKFIYECAKKNPHVNFIGIEKFDSVLIRALEKLLDDPLPNLKLIRVDAENLMDIFAKGEIEKIYLNFSDPWPKKRTAKRRLTSEQFLNRYVEVLENPGTIQLKTDNFGLYQFSMMEFNRHPLYQIEDIRLDLYRHLPTDNIQTEFEQKFVENGNQIFYMKVRFIGSGK
ncbi:MAG TPA: tRNA (guanosine(46)-N7)-methyltransferase TrmB [Bacillota bacterium]|nr:tRNA (guanosine(46)-N7)-methyltransferase TrmB [Bacillota bacterium]